VALEFGNSRLDFDAQQLTYKGEAVVLRRQTVRGRGFRFVARLSGNAV